jgi:hypothetical protein
MLVRITGSGFVKTGSVTDGHPVEFRHWKEVVDSAEDYLESAASSDEEEAVVELWLEDPMSFQAYFDEESGEATPMGPGVARVHRTAGSMIRSADPFGRKTGVVKTATNWDQEFADAQAHAKSVMAKLGNGR